MRSLEQILIADLGVSGFSSHWTLTEATGLSADGPRDCRQQHQPSGQSEGWRCGVCQLQFQKIKRPFWIPLAITGE